MSTTPAGRPDALKALDSIANGAGADNVPASVRKDATPNSPESNAMIQKMMVGASGDTMSKFVGQSGDCHIADNSAPASPQATDQAHRVTGDVQVDSTVGVDTKYSVSANGSSSDQAKHLANSQADNVLATSY